MRNVPTLIFILLVLNFVHSVSAVCDPNPCNDATCIPSSNSYVCQCSPGFFYMNGSCENCPIAFWGDGIECDRLHTSIIQKTNPYADFDTKKYSSINGTYVAITFYNVSARSFNSSNAYIYLNLSDTPIYYTQPDDLFIYDIYYVNTTVFPRYERTAFDLGNQYAGGGNNCLRNSRTRDQNDLDAHPDSNITEYATQKWYTRVFNLTKLSRPFQYWAISNENDDMYTWVAWVREARIVHSDGSIALWILQTNDCDANGCMNGARCVDGIGNYSCECLPNYSGQYCEIVASCSLSPCMNGGTCRIKNTSTNANDFECECVPGYVGRYCEIQKYPSSCLPVQCLNGGTCMYDLVMQNYTCLCRRMYYGPSCEFVESAETDSGSSKSKTTVIIVVSTGVALVLAVIAVFCIIKLRKRKPDDKYLENYKPVQLT